MHSLVRFDTINGHAHHSGLQRTRADAINTQGYMRTYIEPNASLYMSEPYKSNYTSVG